MRPSAGVPEDGRDRPNDTREQAGMAAVTTETTGEVAVLTIDNPPVNGLGADIRTGLDRAVQAALADPAIKAIVITGAGRLFSGGADIKEFNTEKGRIEPVLNVLIDRIEASQKPVIVALHGSAMGGGTELALGCHYRIAAPGTGIGLPEIKLGLLPGAGGTQRLPRLVGVEAALDVILTGDPVPAERALEIGLIDRIAGSDLVADAIAFAKAIVGAGKGPRPISTMEDKLEAARSNRQAFEDARRQAASRARGFEAPTVCIDAIEWSLDLPFAEGKEKERDAFLALVTTDQSKAQRHAFFAEREAAKIPDLPKDVAPMVVRKAAVIGCGTMGGGIAMCFANAGIPVTVLENDKEALERGLARIRTLYAGSVSRGRIDQAEADRRVGLITGTTAFEDLGEVDLVIEAVFETMKVKEEVFSKLDRVTKPEAILATNTSTLDVDRIARATGRPEKVVGMHFFSPANVMRLLENVRGEASSPETIKTAMSLGKRLGKTAVLAGVCDGFIGNRMLYAYTRQANFLLEEGALPQEVDKVIYDFGFPMGPFAMGDLAGLDVGWRIRQERASTRPTNLRYSPIADRICEQGRFGQKTGAGWYRYEEGSRKPLPDPEIEALILEVSKEQGIERRKISDQEILERCIYPLINEGAKILEEGIAIRSSDIDIVWLYGYGFPRYRGGPMFYADTVGPKTIYETMVRLHETHGDWLEPAPLLAELAASGGRFGDL
jgi:3-hydroxyacyl-CoA dehydrogenase